jgi:hypothetical protein
MPSRTDARPLTSYPAVPEFSRKASKWLQI